MTQFVGRKEELAQLQNLLSRRIASLAVIKGRRRIGKSTLVSEFAKRANRRFVKFAGLPPVIDSSAADQRKHFAKQFAEQFGIPITSNDWFDLINGLANITAQEKIIILLDEISWMGRGDPNFLGVLKTAWDEKFSQNPNLILILCGSVSAWIEKNIISSTGFFGRINLKLTLDELSLSECNELLEDRKFKKSAMQKFMILAVTGGVPWYINQIDGKKSAAENIKKLCFSPNGLLVDEYQFIFNDLFGGRRGEVCRKIVEYLASGPAEPNEIGAHVDYGSGGSLSEYLNDLVTSGFVSRDFIWDLKTGRESRVSQYRLTDNYLRFFLRYMAPHLNRIKKGAYAHIALTGLPGWEGIMGLQFENLVANNADLILRHLELDQAEIVDRNPFFQRKTERKPGCQIDYLIQAKYNTLYVCEVKFSEHEVAPKVIDEVKNKIAALSKPRNFACIPVLIVVNGVKKAVSSTEYFAEIINFEALLEA